MFGAEDDSPSFWDLLDVVNPLQHIPLVNDVYRELSGDKIGIAARLTGGALFGGVIGLIGAAISGVVEESTGATAGGHVLALFRDESTPDGSGSGTALAQAVPPPAQAQAATDDPAQAQTAEAKTTETKTAETKTTETKTATSTDARPIILADMIGDEPAAPAAMPRAPVSTSAAAAPSGETAQAAQTTQAASEPAAISVAATAASANAWTSRQSRVLTMPPRTTPLATRSPPAVATSVSGNSGRSALPVTGARPQSGLIAPANAAPIAAAQADSPQTDGTKNAAAAPVANDWFSAAMAEGLNKYQKSNARAAETAAP
ncbi:hypothetical protein [Magnetospirillum fulvum]|nr:hypothetical protein [Magnetospirillum fulvum]